jgi:hypothetical protein
VDRLSRSLLDFAKLMEVFDRHRVSFVSVTQQFTTATSMGRLVLNVLLSFAQFEREIISEPTRDKMAATRRKGKWAGGVSILGYAIDPRGGRLVLNEDEAVQGRAIFELYLQYESLLPVVQELHRRGWVNKRWSTRDGRQRGGPEGEDFQEVVPFPGGLDSLGGAVQEILQGQRKVALVSHRPVSKLYSCQKALVAALGDRLTDPRLRPLHVAVEVNKGKSLGRDFTQRSRSFLFAAVAVVVARLFGLRRVRFYENGVTSLNLPISPQVLGGRATRTTHPRVLDGFGRLFSLLMGCEFVVENPFLWKTKAEVLAGIKAAGCG